MKVLCAALFILAATVSARSAPVAVGDVCPNFNEVMSRAPFPSGVFRRGIASGEVTVTFTVTANDQTTDVVADNASDRMIEEWAIGIVKQLRCSSGGQAQRLSIPFSFGMGMGASSTVTRDDISAGELRDIVPRIAHLKVTPETFNLKVGEGVNIEEIKVLAYDGSSKFLGRLRQFDREAQPKEVFVMRGAGVVQAKSPGVGFLELSTPTTVWQQLGLRDPRPAVRVRISVAE